MKRRTFLQQTGAQAGAAVLLSDIVSAAAAPNAIKAHAPEKIKIGQIGVCHEHAGVRMAALRQLPDLFEVVGVVDDRHSRAARYGGDHLKPYDGLPWLSEEELFAVPGLQAVLVETANGDLVPTATRCMERGVAIAMDKPGGEDLELFRALLDGCAKQKLPFQMGYMFRGNPAFRFCLDAVEKGWLGEIFEMRAGMSHDYGNDRYQKYLSSYAGGIMFNLGCHHIDFAVAMLGRPDEVVSVLGTTAGASHGVKNNSVAMLQYPHALVTIHASDQETSGLRYRQLKVSGEWGTIEVCPLERFDGKPLQLNLRLKRANEAYPAGEHVVDFGIQKDRYEAQLVEFAQVIRGEVAPSYGLEHDLLVQHVHLAASGYLDWKCEEAP